MRKRFKIFIGSDHAGFNLKNSLNQFLIKGKYKVEDLGPYKYDREDDYPDYALKVCKKVLKANSKGILICGSGQGMAISANKVPGILATICWDEKSGKIAAAHGRANVLCLGENLIKPRNAEKIVKMWLEAPYTIEKRHIRRLNKIKKIEKKYLKY